MNKKEYSEKLEKFFEDLKQRSNSKSSEYATDENVFDNFEKATGLSLHNKPEEVAWEYMVKHLENIKTMISTDNIYNYEFIEEKIGDAILYLVIIKELLNKRQY